MATKAEKTGRGAADECYGAGLLATHREE